MKDLKAKSGRDFWNYVTKISEEVDQMPANLKRSVVFSKKTPSVKESD